MKKLIVLVVGLGLFIHFYPDSPVSEWFYDQKEAITDKVDSISGTDIQFNFRNALNELTKNMPEFNANERAYVESITRTKEEVADFFQKYCEEESFNAQLKAENLQVVCNYLDKQSALF